MKRAQTASSSNAIWRSMMPATSDYIGRMTRPLRFEFAGALYHVTSRGDRSGAIYRDDGDRHVWLEVLGRVCRRHNFIVHAFCQMTNHYHVLLETVDGDLARGMRQLNGAYSQHFNRRHGVMGHVFQGRYHAVLVQKETYLLELARYIVLNPIRAGMVASLSEWHWSSHHYMAQGDQKPAWLETDSLLGHFGADRASAYAAYTQFILAGKGLLSPLRDVRYQMLLGDENYIARHMNADTSAALAEIVRVQRKSGARSLDEFARCYERRDEAMAQAYRSMAYSMQEIADHFGTSTRTVGRAVSRFSF